MDIFLAMGAPGVTASAATRTLAGTVVRFDEYGLTSAGRLKVAPGALQFPEDLGAVKLTREHNLDESRGHLVAVHQDNAGIRASAKVADGQAGDDAIREAKDRTRDGLSFHVVDAQITDDTITSGRVVAIGQVGVPAYESGRIDTIAAAMKGSNPMQLTEQQRARLTELRAKQNRTAEETSELNALATLAGEQGVETPSSETPATSANGSSPEQQASPQAAAAQPASQGTQSAQQVAASMQAVPGGVPNVQTTPATSRPRGAAFAEFVTQVTAGLVARTQGDSSGLATITAALSDITNTAHKGIIEPPAWSGELWSGLVYEPLFLDLFASGDLTSWEGKGWRFTKKLAIADYAGDKAAIPTDTITTEAGSYEAARMAVGVDIDRKFFDFPNEGFVASLFEQVRESWTIKLDSKVAAYIAANMAPALDNELSGAGVALDPFTSLLKAAAAAVRALKRRRVGKASFILVNDDDMFSLFDVASKDVSAFLDLFDIDPSNFRSAPASLVPVGTVVAGVKQAATVRTLPGSPIRVEAQNLTNAGVDDAFFGYWAIEEHHTTGIAKTTFDPDFVPA